MNSVSWISLTATLIMFIMWMFTMHKWMEAKRESDAKDLTIATLRDNNRSFWKEEARKFQRDLENQTDTIGKYIVEVNKGTYLVECEHDAYEYWKNHGTVPTSYFFSFTENPFKATHYGKLETAKKHAKKCGGRVVQHKPNLEVVE
ncbi:hypothetical protein [Staphylococcus haemolyticus]|uniref:hypothetical protein n=1 Tax=Staphylococcus haemolyticus TaxID=1283 RepID=UPI0007359A77|nr:hypothetical protein [Staphylococcus haemolyticus]AYX83227.1 hypothetical protein EGX85_02160 [Staphylococcus haemolyticus]MBC3101956.1 hypothetical protein [Staphylococcus haemolyticus]MBC3142813.1 hypothetical protein [Staphylococcus haemolyticus]MBW5900666.1 hypothetical protein [Staphylococcus haemolyticus]MCH4336073.1 hypothetical protein [Staphylococcus haemolyticus]